MRQFEGYSLTTPIAIGDVRDLSNQVLDYLEETSLY